MQPSNLITQLISQRSVTFLQGLITVRTPERFPSFTKRNSQNINIGGAILLCFAILFFIAFYGCTTEEVGVKMSGIVLDEGGMPVKGLAIVCQPARTKEGELEHGFWIQDYPSHLKSVTDKNGRFKFSNLPYGPIKFALTSWLDKKTQIRQYQLISIKIGTLRYHPYGIHPKYFAFEIKPDPHFENIEVAVRPHTQIRARVVLKSGKPLVNTRVLVARHRRESTGKKQNEGTWEIETDSKGYFMFSLHDYRVPAYYTLTVRYQDARAESEEFKVNRSELCDIVLKLNMDKVPKMSKIDRTDEEQQNIPQPPSELMTPDPNWVINPANGHAYKRIRCISRDEAQAIAASEDAYLVAINDEAEQKWLEGVFGTHLYWIGLSDTKEESNWKWSDGQPLTYTNWGPANRFHNSVSAEEKDYAVMSFVEGEWHPVGIGDLFWRATGQAILEKE
ncbi:hypothetical protein C6501_02890 [Candidatus Poribacteria bacterium]|nr:MAG: hypothetical protein C6501_02890 [Candidatus Poribacteria bacterium]